VLPHLQGAALVDAELDDVHVCPTVSRQVPLVDVEIVAPLRDQAAFVLDKIPLQIVHCATLRE
jgi:hypothetical protein